MIRFAKIPEPVAVEPVVTNSASVPDQALEIAAKPSSAKNRRRVSGGSDLNDDGSDRLL